MDMGLTIHDFLPVSREDMHARDWYYYDFLLITGDAYIDHPGFGAAVIGRVLEAEGYRVAILPQPSFRDESEITAMGRPRYAALVTAGNLDSMVAHYTASKKPRSDDSYSLGKKAGKRPDRAVIVYSSLARKAFPGLPIIIGGLEASLRRFAHYDYWDDKVRRPILADSGADMLVYGMGESAISEIARRLADKENKEGKESISGLIDIRGTGILTDDGSIAAFPSVACASFEVVSNDKQEYAKAAMIQHDEHDPVRGKAITQRCSEKTLVINPPPPAPSTQELDKIYALPYTREVHPMYKESGHKGSNDKGTGYKESGDFRKDGGVPAIEEVRFSVIHNRGCFGACNYCALAFHQGRTVASRSHESVIKEVESFTGHPEFKGFVHDVGGPTANFRRPSCTLQRENGMCAGKTCLVPPCENLDADHTDYLLLLRKLTAIPGVKKVFVRSGIRFDYMMLDKSGEFFAELVKNHISGQLKVAPEHCVDSVLYYMGKPRNAIYEKFLEKYKRLNMRYGKDQYLVPYLISSHPGSTIADAIALAEYLNTRKQHPEQVQDFYPTPGTLSTCMYYTGLDPRTMKPVYVPKSRSERRIQRALLQWRKPENRAIVHRALRDAGRGDLIGYGKKCLVRPEKRNG